MLSGKEIATIPPPRKQADPTKHLKRIYHDANGTIVGWDINNGLARDDYPHIEINDERFDLDIDPSTHKIVSGQLVEMSDEEKKVAAQPTELDVRYARGAELRETDWREKFEDWAKYRQQLRDITDHGDPVSMVKAWPKRPDGEDAITHLRKRI